VTNLRKMTTSVQNLCFGFGAIVCALACGASDEGAPTPPDGPDSPRTDVPPPEQQLSPVCDDNPLAKACSPQGMAPELEPPKVPSEAEQARARAEGVLAANCGQCHGPTLSTTTASGGVNYIDDIDALVKGGKIVPLNSAASLLVQLIVRGDMPPRGARPPMSQIDLRLVTDYIDNPRYWPAPSVSECESSGEVVDFDELFQAINRDLVRADDEDTPFYRYLSLSNHAETGCDGGALDQQRSALFKLLNMLSIKATVEQPVPIDDEQLIYRVDLRDFDWNRAVSVNGENFADVWEAIADSNPYAVEFVGDDADDAKDDTATAFPVMFVDQALDVAAIGNLYYAIIGVDVTQPLSAFVVDQLGIDVVQDVEDGEVIRAGTTRSRISRQDRLIERHDIVVRSGAFWQSFDFADDANESIFEDPFGFSAGGSEVIFTLPNGMLGYIIADAADNIVEDSDILLDATQDNFRAVTAVSCSNCHAAGLLPVVDEVRTVALDNARALGLNQDEVELLEEIYVTPQAFAEQAQRDSTGFYRRALEQADLAVQGSDPVAGAFLRFEQDVQLAAAAGDLGLSAEELEQNLNLLDPVLAVLRKGTLDRDDFTAVFVASLCELSGPLQNQPDPAVCDDAIAALDD
jgi:mono/diheme cytochrome c family protein